MRWDKIKARSEVKKHLSADMIMFSIRKTISMLFCAEASKGGGGNSSKDYKFFPILIYAKAFV